MGCRAGELGIFLGVVVVGLVSWVYPWGGEGRAGQLGIFLGWWGRAGELGIWVVGSGW